MYGANSQPMLASITEKGNNMTALPPTKFDYKPEIKSWNYPPELWLNHADIDAHLAKPEVQMADVNGDGLVDIVRTFGSIWKVLLNRGDHWDSAYQRWSDGSSGAANGGLTDTQIRLVDVTGDNLPDIVRSFAGDVGGRSHWEVWRNLGNRWNTTREAWIDNYNLGAYFNQNNDVTMGDVNGDSLTDIVQTTHDNNSRWQVYLNTGNNSWNTTPQIWIEGNMYAHLEDNNIRLMDVTGDGLPDIVKTDDSGIWAAWYVWRNTGSSWRSIPETWLNGNVNAHLRQSDVALSDVNGDGLVDIVKSEDTGGPDRWKVAYNKGNGWSSEWSIWMDTSANIDVDANSDLVRITDVTGDGLPDIVKGEPDGSSSSDTWRVWKNSGSSPYLLAKVTTTEGGTISFDYTPSTKYNNNGSDNISDLPFPLWLVSKMTVGNGMTNTHGTNDTTTFSYTDGFYKWQDREFRGFGTIDETLPNNAKNKHVFYQDDMLKGRYAEVQTRDSSNNPYLELEYIWGTSSLNGVNIINLSSQKNYTFDGTTTNPKITQVDYQYDMYGNITKKSELGDISITGDERYINNSYLANPSLWIVNKPYRIFMENSDHAQINEDKYFYDGGIPGAANPPPVKGDLTRVVKWLNIATSNPETVYEYDGFGNQTKVIDANNHPTGLTYDATGTYPASTTNAKDQTSYTSYDLATGNLLSKTDPNNFVTWYQYDPFGRIISEIQPYDNGSYPTVSYEYFTDGTAPEGVLVSKREVSGAAGTLDTYTYSDGLGRKIQTRSDTEDITKQIVSDTFYDPTGEIAKQTVTYHGPLSTNYTDPDTAVRSTITSYDPVGRPGIITNPNGGIKTITYDHWKETIIDENGHIKRNYYTVYNKINKIEEVNGVNTYTTTYTYDSLDNVTKITDAATNNINFQYDSLGRKMTQADPDMGTWRYEYDAAGNLIKQTDNRSIVTAKTYDPLNRVLTIDYPNDTDITYTYDGTGAVGTLASVTDATGTISYGYDNRLRKLSETRVINGITFLTRLQYDALNRVTTRLNPDGINVDYSYNNQGEPEKVNNLIDNIDYNAQNKVTKKLFNNGLMTTYTYNTDDFRLNNIMTGNVMDLSYTYDPVGNILSKKDNLLTKTQSFGYDDLDRLTTAQEGGGYDYAYQYNAIGNLTKFTNSGNVIDYTYGQNAGPHALTSSTETSAPTPTPTIVPTPTPTPQPTVSPSVTPSVTPTVTPTPSVPPTSSFIENWSSGIIDTAKWNNWGNPQTSVVNNQLKITSVPAGGYYGLDSRAGGKIYNLTGSYAQNQLVDAGNQSIATWETFTIVIFKDSDTNYELSFFVSNNNIVARHSNPNGFTNIKIASYDQSIHKYFKIRESNGTLFWDTSADGLSWNNFTSVANPFDITAVRIGMMVGTWRSETNTTSATYDNYNVIPVVTPTPTPTLQPTPVPPTPTLQPTATPTPTPVLTVSPTGGPTPTPTIQPASSFKDDWATGSISTSKWSNWGGTKATVSNYQLKITSTLAAGYYGIESKIPYNLTGSYVMNKLVSAGNQSITSWEVVPIVITNKNATGKNNITFFVTNKKIYARKVVAGVTTNIRSATYSSTSHKWLRVRESGGKIYFDTSSNKTTWTNFTSTTNPFDIKSVHIGMQSGTWKSQSSITYSLFDDFNM